MILKRTAKFFGWTSIALALAFGVLALGFNQNDNTLAQNTVRGGVAALTIVILCNSVLYQGFTRKILTDRVSSIIKTVFLAYLAFLVIIYFNNAKDGLTIINNIYPGYSGQESPKFMVKTKSCQFNVRELLRDIDEYFLCHALGWFLMTLLTKDVKLIFMLGVFDEVFEFTTREVVPLFGECWFDQIFYDMLITNLTGLMLGYFVIKKFGIRQNDLFGGDLFFLKNDTQRRQTFWTRLTNLRFFHSSKRMYLCFIIVFFKCANLISTFLLLDVLWIPIVSVFCVLRLLAWGFCFSEMVHETHTYLEYSDKMLDAQSKTP